MAKSLINMIAKSQEGVAPQFNVATSRTDIARPHCDVAKAQMDDKSQFHVATSRFHIVKPLL